MHAEVLGHKTRWEEGRPLLRTDLGTRTGDRLLIVSACSGKKLLNDRRHLRREDFADPERFARRERELAELRRQAGDMYTGAEHQIVSLAFRRLLGALGPDAVEHSIVSAGYGTLAPEKEIVPYDLTFSGMGRTELDAWSLGLRLPTTTRELVADWPLVVFALGGDYLRAIRAAELAPIEGQRFVFLAARGQWGRLEARPRVTVVDAGAGAEHWDFNLRTRKGSMLLGLAAAAAEEGPGVLRRLASGARTGVFERRPGGPR